MVIIMQKNLLNQNEFFRARRNPSTSGRDGLLPISTQLEAVRGQGSSTAIEKETADVTHSRQRVRKGDSGGPAGGWTSPRGPDLLRSFNR
jgi:hypothetical protein